MKLGWVITLYIIYFVLTTLLVVYTVQSTKRHIETEMFAQDVCFKCMMYFQDVLGQTDTSLIIPYIEKRADFIQMTVSQLMDLVKNALQTCPKQGASIGGDGFLTIADVEDCVLKQVKKHTADCEASGISRSECAIIPRLADDLLKKALTCGANVCTVADMQNRFEQAGNIMLDELMQCRRNFASPDAECVKSYAEVIMLKTAAAKKDAQLMSDTTPITRAELRDESRRVAEFVMSQ